MKSMIDLYIGQLAAEEKSLETLKQYAGVLRRLECWFGSSHNCSITSEDISKITGVMLTEYYQYLFSRGLSIATRNNYVVIIKDFFEFLTQVNIIQSNPSAVLHCVKGKKNIKADDTRMYTKEEIEALLDFLTEREPLCNDLRDIAIIALILGSGLRASEICNLNMSHLAELRRGVVHCKRKGGVWKDVYVAEYVLLHIERYIIKRKKAAPDTPLFLSTQGNRLTRYALWKSLAAKQRRIELATGVHIFRHTFLSSVDQLGGAAIARDLAGHSSVTITDTYLHTSPEERKEAVNRTAFAELLQ